MWQWCLLTPERSRQRLPLRIESGYGGPETRALTPPAPDGKEDLMRALTVLLVSVLLLASSAPAFATDLDRFKNKVERSAPDEVVASPPVICVCKDGGSPELHNKAGQLRSFPFLGIAAGTVSIWVFCLIPDFSIATGQWATGYYCPVWELLPK